MKSDRPADPETASRLSEAAEQTLFGDPVEALKATGLEPNTLVEYLRLLHHDRPLTWETLDGVAAQAFVIGVEIGRSDGGVR